jgi:hypothetical protein
MTHSVASAFILVTLCLNGAAPSLAQYVIEVDAVGGYHSSQVSGLVNQRLNQPETLDFSIVMAEPMMP